MMSKVIKNIPVFFLWLAGLSVCAHLIIPHDHHLVESVTSQDESCPVSNNKPGHHTGFPIHCNAFNDLATEKATTFVLNKNIQSDDLSFSSFPDALAVELQISIISVFDIREPFSDPSFLRLSRLSAPPSLS